MRRYVRRGTNICKKIEKNLSKWNTWYGVIKFKKSLWDRWREEREATLYTMKILTVYSNSRLEILLLLLTWVASPFQKERLPMKKASGTVDAEGRVKLFMQTSQTTGLLDLWANCQKAPLNLLIIDIWWSWWYTCSGESIGYSLIHKKNLVDQLTQLAKKFLKFFKIVLGEPKIKFLLQFILVSLTFSTKSFTVPKIPRYEN